MADKYVVFDEKGYQAVLQSYKDDAPPRACDCGDKHCPHKSNAFISLARYAFTQVNLKGFSPFDFPTIHSLEKHYVDFEKGTVSSELKRESAANFCTRFQYDVVAAPAQPGKPAEFEIRRLFDTFDGFSILPDPNPTEPARPPPPQVAYAILKANDHEYWFKMVDNCFLNKKWWIPMHMIQFQRISIQFGDSDMRKITVPIRMKVVQSVLPLGIGWRLFDFRMTWMDAVFEFSHGVFSSVSHPVNVPVIPDTKPNQEARLDCCV